MLSLYSYIKLLQNSESKSNHTLKQKKNSVGLDERCGEMQCGTFNLLIISLLMQKNFLEPKILFKRTPKLLSFDPTMII